MSTNRDQFVIDESGNKTAVLVRIDRYSELLEAQDESKFGATGPGEVIRK